MRIFQLKVLNSKIKSRISTKKIAHLKKLPKKVQSKHVFDGKWPVEAVCIKGGNDFWEGNFGEAKKIAFFSNYPYMWSH